MASAWAELSKEDQEDYSERGYNKKSYNDEYGNGGERAPSSSLSAEELIQKYTPNAAAAAESSEVPENWKITTRPSETEAAASESPEQTANRAEAKERSQNHTASASTSTTTTNTKDGKIEAPSWYKNADGSTPSTMQTGLTKEEWESRTANVSSVPNISSDMEGYDTDRKYMGPDGGTYTAKEADDAGWTPGYYDEGADGHYLVGYDDRTPREKSQDSHYAYLDAQAEIQALKLELGPRNVYGRQSARDTHERHMAAGKPKVTGPAGVEDPYLIAQNEIADELYKTGYDYTAQEMTRHANGGADLSKTNSYLYDEYGGYDNWYNNHSLYSGNFTGSKDLMDFDEVMDIGRLQQDAMKKYQVSDEYMNKYGEYDWAQSFYEDHGPGAS